LVEIVGVVKEGFVQVCHNALKGAITPTDSKGLDAGFLLLVSSAQSTLEKKTCSWL
jgi:hypothetical protein